MLYLNWSSKIDGLHFSQTLKFTDVNKTEDLKEIFKNNGIDRFGLKHFGLE